MMVRITGIEHLKLTLNCEPVMYEFLLMHYKYKRIELNSVDQYLIYLKKGYVRLKIDDSLIPSLKERLKELKDKDPIFLFEYSYYLFKEDSKKYKDEVFKQLTPYEKDIFASYVLGLFENSPYSTHINYSSNNGFFPAIYELAFMNYQKENYLTAFKLFKKCLKVEIKDAYNYVGLCYMYGNGVKEDDTKAKKYFEEGVKHGDLVYAPYNMGDLYYRQKAFNSAEFYYEMAYMNGNKYAAFEVGLSSYKMKDWVKAKEYFSKEDSINTNPESYNYLGLMALYGYGESKDLGKAESLFEKALDKGFKIANYNLACVEAQRGNIKNAYNYLKEDTTINDKRESRKYLGFVYSYRKLYEEISRNYKIIKTKVGRKGICVREYNRKNLELRDSILKNNVDILFNNVLNYRINILKQDYSKLKKEYLNIQKKCVGPYSRYSINDVNKYSHAYIEYPNMECFYADLLVELDKYINYDQYFAYFMMVQSDRTLEIIKALVYAFNNHITSFEAVLKEEQERLEKERLERERLEREEEYRNTYTETESDTSSNDDNYDWDYDTDSDDDDSDNGDITLVDDYGNEVAHVNQFGYDEHGDRWESDGYFSDTYHRVDDDDDED